MYVLDLSEEGQRWGGSGCVQITGAGLCSSHSRVVRRGEEKVKQLCSQREESGEGREERGRGMAARWEAGSGLECR